MELKATGPARAWNTGELAPALLLLALLLAGLAFATLAPGGRGGQYAVIAPPWFGAGQTFSLVALAGGRIADAGGPGNIVIAQSADPDFIASLYRAGAWLVVDPVSLRGCRAMGRR